MASSNNSNVNNSSNNNNNNSDNRSMESRTGRTKQRYNSNGERLVAGVVPLNSTSTEVMLIQSTRRKGWVLPKGGWESDETCEEAARREAWEEAGIDVKVETMTPLTPILDSRPPKKLSKEAPKALYQFYVAQVEDRNIYAEWPEMHKRERSWFTYSQAREALSGRPELLAALDQTQIMR